MFAALILAHYVVLRQMAPAPLGEGPAAVAATANRGIPAYVIWSGCVAVFTLGAMLVSWFAWRWIGYLGTLFYMASAFIWAARWLAGEERTPEDIALYDARLVA